MGWCSTRGARIGSRAYRSGATPAAAARLAAALALALFAPAPAESQADPGASPFGDFNLPYAYYFGIGAFTVGDDRVRAFGVVARPTLKEYGPGGVGWALRVGASVTVLESRSGFLPQLDELTGYMVVPGVEARILLGERHLLKPFVDLGVAVDDYSDATATMAGLGIESEHVFAAGDFELALTPGALFSLSRSREALYDDTFLAFRLGLDVRRPIGLRIAGARADVGLQVTGTSFWGDVGFGATPSSVTEIGRQLEVGVSFGTNPRPKVWFFRLPRLTLAFRFGTGFRGVRLGFADRMLRLAPAEP